jgi:hypothetical protein
MINFMRMFVNPYCITVDTSSSQLMSDHRNGLSSRLIQPSNRCQQWWESIGHLSSSSFGYPIPSQKTTSRRAQRRLIQLMDVEIQLGEGPRCQSQFSPYWNARPRPLGRRRRQRLEMIRFESKLDIERLKHKQHRHTHRHHHHSNIHDNTNNTNNTFDNDDSDNDSSSHDDEDDKALKSTRIKKQRIELKQTFETAHNRIESMIKEYSNEISTINGQLRHAPTISNIDSLSEYDQRKVSGAVRHHNKSTLIGKSRHWTSYNKTTKSDILAHLTTRLINDARANGGAPMAWQMYPYVAPATITSDGRRTKRVPTHEHYLLQSAIGRINKHTEKLESRNQLGHQMSRHLNDGHGHIVVPNNRHVCTAPRSFVVLSPSHQHTHSFSIHIISLHCLSRSNVV